MQANTINLRYKATHDLIRRSPIMPVWLQFAVGIITALVTIVGMVLTYKLGMITQLYARVKTLEDEKTVLAGKYDDLRDKYTVLSSDVLTTKAENVTLRNENVTLRESNTLLTSQNSELKLQVDTVQEQNTTILAELKQHRERLSVMERGAGHMPPA